jgi:DMSO/TMAO reductase YedYZ molybdopterin-dependent catalytic subunit
VPQKTDASRRAFLETSVQTAAGLCLAPLARAVPPPAVHAAGETLLGTLPFVGEGTFPLDATGGAGLGRRRALDLSALTPETLITPTERFFVRTGCPDRLPPTDSWKVRVHGLVAAPLEIGIAELRGAAAPRGVHLVECAGNSRAAHFGLMSVARWTGVPLESVLARARPLARATQVLVSGFDEHDVSDPGSVPGASWVFGLAAAREAGAFLATEMNGAPLLPDHGHPLRLVVPGWYGCTAIKWVNEIALVDDTAPATDQMREYAGRTHQDPAGPRDRSLMEAGRRPEGPPLARDFRPATVDFAAAPVRVEKCFAAGAIAYRVVGIAWGGGGAPAALRIRLRPEDAFVPVETQAEAGPAWRLWSHTLRAPAPGRYRIELAVGDAAVRARRLEAGFYAREFDVPAG